MRIVVVSTFYSEGMGYTENCLPKALAALGHDVHVVASNYNVYGNSTDYDKTYAAFLGPRRTPIGTTRANGYQVHRLDAKTVAGYIWIEGLSQKVREIAPDIVHSIEIASLPTFALAFDKHVSGYKLFCETHQHMSVVKPFLKQPGLSARKAIYWATRTLPTRLASLAVEKCYAIAPDCADVARVFYGVPAAKVVLQPLGTDTDLFRPVETDSHRSAWAELRQKFGYAESDIICIYTGRLSADKNPLLLAQAIKILNRTDPRYKGLFIGEGVQKREISECTNSTVQNFIKYDVLPDYYRSADIAVWPTQESLSMLDAAASGLPLVVSDAIGEAERVRGSGKTYRENNANDLAAVLLSLADAGARKAYGTAGRQKMVGQFSWARSALAIDRNYREALGQAPRVPAAAGLESQHS